MLPSFQICVAICSLLALAAAQDEERSIWLPEYYGATGLFDPFTHWCCNGNVVRRPGDTTNYQCCGSEVCHIDQQRHECCDDNRFFLSDPSTCIFEYDCCSGQTYNTNTAKCCDGVLHNVPYRTLEGLDAEILQLLDEDCLEHVPQPNWECCGKSIINTQGHICCNGVALKRTTPYDTCCESTSYDARTENCCWSDEGSVVVPGGLGRGCCGHQSYDYTNEHCCSSWNSTTGQSEYAVSEVTSDYQGCCGLNVYNWATQICCWEQNAIVNKPPYSGINDYYGCCGLQPMQYGKQGCCANQLYDLNCGIECCGSHLYKPADDILCCYDYVSGGSNLLSNGGDKSARCCAGQIYHPAYQLCCNEVIIDLRTTDHPSHLVHLDFAPDTGLQVATSVHIRPGHHACCGSAAYDTVTERCCSTTVYKICDYPRPYQCCNDLMYLPEDQVCCSGAVFDIENPLATQCCYQWCSGDCGYPGPIIYRGAVAVKK